MTIRNFRYVATIEATSFLVLLYFSVINRSESMVSILGALHGALFIAYVGFAWLLREKAGWSPVQTLWILLGAVVPFGGFVVDWWLAKNHAAEAEQPISD